MADAQHEQARYLKGIHIELQKLNKSLSVLNSNIVEGIRIMMPLKQALDPGQMSLEDAQRTVDENDMDTYNRLMERTQGEGGI